MFSKLWNAIKEIIRSMIGGRTIEQTLHVAPVLSKEMENAIELWGKMYKNKAPWLHEPDKGDPTRIVSLGLPSLIASEKARMVVLEWESEITAPTEEVEVENHDYVEPQPDIFGNVIPSVQKPTKIEEKPIGNVERAEFLNEIYQKKLRPKIRKQLEYAIAKGGMVIKPYLVYEEMEDDNGQIQKRPTFEFDFVQADCFYPISFNASEEITEAAFLQTRMDKNITYRRLEYHKWSGDKVTIINKAFKTENNNTFNSGYNEVDLGQEIALTEVDEWKEIEPKVELKGMTKPLFVYFRMPEANTIDTMSPLGVSGYSRAVQLIKDADMQYSRVLWEYEAGEMAVNIDRDAFHWLSDKEGDTDKGKSMLGSMQQRLYRQVDINPTTELFDEYAPQLRDSQYINGLNNILMRIEDAVGLARGTLSDITGEARTATELKILKQRSFSVNAEIQKTLQKALEDTIDIMNTYCTLYEVTPEGEYDVSFEWDDSIIVDVEAELNKRMVLLQNGLSSKLEVRMWYFGETERQAQEALMRIEEENTASMEQDLAMQSNMAGIQVQKKQQEEEVKQQMHPRNAIQKKSE